MFYFDKKSISYFFLIHFDVLAPWGEAQHIKDTIARCSKPYLYLNIGLTRWHYSFLLSLCLAVLVRSQHALLVRLVLVAGLPEADERLQGPLQRQEQLWEQDLLLRQQLLRSVPLLTQQFSYCRHWRTRVLIQTVQKYMTYWLIWDDRNDTRLQFWE